MAYTDAQVRAALLAERREWRFRYDLLDQSGRVIGQPDVEPGGDVEYSDLADVQRTGKFVIRADADINYSTDRLRPQVSLLMDDGGWHSWSLGVFLLSSPVTRYGSAPKHQPREVTGYDQGLILRDDKVLDRYTIAAGANYLEEVRKLLTSAGLQSANLSADARTLPAAKEWEPGTPKYTIVNELLGAINYRSLWFDADGRPVAQPYQSPSEAPPLWTYAFDRKSLTLPGVTHTLDLTSVPNAFVMVVSEPDRDPLRAQYINTSPNSPTSTVNVGRTIVDYREGEDAADQATLDEKVKRAAESASQVYAQLSFSTTLMPIHGAADVILADFGIDGTGAETGPVRFRETKWSITMEVGAPMTHEARRVVTL